MVRFQSNAPFRSYEALNRDGGQINQTKGALITRLRRIFRSVQSANTEHNTE